MIGIVELGNGDEITVYVVGGMSATVHRFKGVGLVQINERLRCSGYLVDQQDYPLMSSPKAGDGLGIKLIENLRLMIRPV